MVAATLLLPVTGLFTRLVRLATLQGTRPRSPFLEDQLLAKPEQALAAVIRELRRMAEVCVDSMMLNGELTNPCPQTFRRLLSNEDVINEVRQSMGDYPNRLTAHYLSRRQTLFLQHLDRPHEGHRAHRRPPDPYRRDLHRALQDRRRPRPRRPVPHLVHPLLLRQARHRPHGPPDPDSNAFQNTALEILRARDAYMIQSMDAKAEFAGAARDKRITPIGGYYLSRYIEDLDRLVRRAKSIAFAERFSDFWVKTAKLEKEAKAALSYAPQIRVDPRKYLDLVPPGVPVRRRRSGRRIPSGRPRAIPPPGAARMVSSHLTPSSP